MQLTQDKIDSIRRPADEILPVYSLAATLVEAN